MTWQEIIFLVLAGIVFLFGSPIIQLIKNLLSKIFKVNIEDRWAISLTFALSLGLAALEMFLTGQFVDLVITPATFPSFFAGIYALAQLYFSWFKKSDTFLGTRALLAPADKQPVG